jgi:MFS family permease
MSTIYPKYSLGLRLGLFAGMYSIAGAFAGLIAYGIFQVKHLAVHNWQLLFLIEGALSIFMAIVTVIALPASLETAWCKSDFMTRHSNRAKRVQSSKPRRLSTR